MAQLAVVLFTLRISNFHISSLTSRATRVVASVYKAR